MEQGCVSAQLNPEPTLLEGPNNILKSVSCECHPSLQSQKRVIPFIHSSSTTKALNPTARGFWGPKSHQSQAQLETEDVRVLHHPLGTHRLGNHMASRSRTDRCRTERSRGIAVSPVWCQVSRRGQCLYPYTPCMAYMPTLGWFGGSM